MIENKTSMQPATVIYQVTAHDLADMCVAAARTALKEFTTTLPPVQSSPQGTEFQGGSRQDAARVLNVSLPVIHDLMNSGIIVFQKIGRRTVIDMQDLQRKIVRGELARYQRRTNKR